MKSIRWIKVDIQRRRLYVAESEFKAGKYTTGRVVVFTV